MSAETGHVSVTKTKDEDEGKMLNDHFELIFTTVAHAY